MVLTFGVLLKLTTENAEKILYKAKNCQPLVTHCAKICCARAMHVKRKRGESAILCVPSVASQLLFSFAPVSFISYLPLHSAL